MSKMSKKKLLWFWLSFEIAYWSVLFLPLLIIVLVKWDTYFAQKSGFTVGLGGVIAILLLVILFKFGTKKFDKVIWATALLVIVYCFQSIINDTLILVFGFWLGAVLNKIVSFPRDYFKKKYMTYATVELGTYAHETTKKEIENGRV